MRSSTRDRRVHALHRPVLRLGARGRQPPLAGVVYSETAPVRHREAERFERARCWTQRFIPGAPRGISPPPPGPFPLGSP
eukprot:7544770-Pyramimonas_sp.AAC.1